MLKRTNRSTEFENREEIILRDYLALERTRLANERTLLAYVRASLSLVVAAAAFFQIEGLENIKWLGYPSVVFGILFALAGILRFVSVRKKIVRYYKNSAIKYAG